MGRRFVLLVSLAAALFAPSAGARRHPPRELRLDGRAVRHRRRAAGLQRPDAGQRVAARRDAPAPDPARRDDVPDRGRPRTGVGGLVPARARCRCPAVPGRVPGLPARGVRQPRHRKVRTDRLPGDPDGDQPQRRAGADRDAAVCGAGRLEPSVLRHARPRRGHRDRAQGARAREDRSLRCLVRDEAGARLRAGAPWQRRPDPARLGRPADVPRSLRPARPAGDGRHAEHLLRRRPLQGSDAVYAADVAAVANRLEANPVTGKHHRAQAARGASISTARTSSAS